MKVLFYPRMSTNSKRALVRTKRRGGRPYTYFPRITLITRLQREFGLSQSQVIDQLFAEREALLKLLS